jgi:hypothetical protein
MFIDGLFDFLNFIVSPSDQPQKFIAFVGVVLLAHALIAVLDLKWGRGVAFTALALLAAMSRQRGWIIGAAVALALTILAPFLLSVISHAIDANTDIFNPRSMYDGDVRLFQAQLVFTVALFAFQLLYLAYGARRIWRIWRSTGSEFRSTSATPLPTAQS